MARVGYHCSHEQHAPTVLLEHARAAMHGGFVHAMCSDHLMPWLPGDEQGQSGFAWSWLGAALQATSMSFGTVTAPGQRYHPVVTAQAIATLADMFPSRFWVALGTGEALNEHVTGALWPSKPARRDRLRESVDIIRALLAGETVVHRGHVTARDAKLYSIPSTPPPLFGAALSVDTAAWAGRWADGLITVQAEPTQLKAVIDAFRDAAGAHKPVYVQVALAYAPTDAGAERIAMAWRNAAVGDSNAKADIATPQEFLRRSASLTIDDVKKAVRTSASRSQHVDWIRADFAAGADRVYVHHVGPGTALQRMFLDDLAPALLDL